MSIKQTKFSNLNDARKTTHLRINNLISQLNAAALEAMEQQAYMRLNPDDNEADSLIAVVTPDFVATANAFQDVADKLQDMQLVASGEMTIESEVSKWGINITEVSDKYL